MYFLYLVIKTNTNMVCIMNGLKNIQWVNPREKIWGFHVHQELPLTDFASSLVTQEMCSAFLQDNKIPIDASDAIKPGYGPHLDYMWELRVESLKQNVLEKMGLAISYMAINRFGLSGYIHPLMQDTTLSEEKALLVEGQENQPNAIWFSYRVPQMQAFFFNPPMDNNNKIIDTRTSRVMSKVEINQLKTLGLGNLNKSNFRHPKDEIIRGFHIHMDYESFQEAVALSIFDNFLIYLSSENMIPTSTRVYGPKENGPHILGGWEVKFETQDRKILEKIGVAIGWLMCNRQNISVFMHPVTWKEGDFEEELKAHKEYSFFLGYLPDLDLRFFSNKIHNKAPGVESNEKQDF